MKRSVFCIFIIMIHGSLGVLAMSALDFNKEIEMVMQDQYKEHRVTLNQTQVTEGAVDFENRFRKPAPAKSLTFFPIKLKPKQLVKPKTKVAESQPPGPSKVDFIKLYREQTL